MTTGLSGAQSGFSIGAPIGAGAASVQARRAGLDPLTGKSINQSIQPATRTESSLTLVTGGDELQYHDRIAGQTDLYHNFPRLLDREIIEYGAPSLRISDRAYWFELPGSINRVEGIYQIGMNQNNVIFHRNFLPLDKYGLQFRLRK